MAPASILDTTPDALALSIVQQYLHENGYTSALSALETETGSSYTAGNLGYLRSSQLLHLAWELYETEASALAADANITDDLQKLDLNRGTCTNYHLEEPQVLLPLSENPIDISLSSSSQELYIATGGANVISVGGITDGTTSVRWSRPAGRAAVLSVSAHSSPSKGLLTVGTMDGCVGVFSAADGTALTSRDLCSRLISKVEWCPGSLCIAAATGKATLQILQLHLGNDPSAPMHEPQQKQLDGDCRLITLQEVPFPKNVTDFVFVHDKSKGSKEARSSIIVAIRDSNLLLQYQCSFADAASSQWPCIELGSEKRLNMNANQDGHVSFCARKLRLSPDESKLMVCTEGQRVLIFQVDPFVCLSAMYGLNVDTFHVPCACWHPAGYHIYAAESSGAIKIFHVGMAKEVGIVHAHTGSVRGMTFVEQIPDATSSPLHMITCAFDKTVKCFTTSEINGGT